jgi:hypothetical protein
MNRTLLYLTLIACGRIEEVDDSTTSSSELGKQAFPSWYALSQVKAQELVLADPSLDEATLKAALGAADDVLVYGRYTRRGAFEIHGAWRALPGVLPAKYSHVYQAAGISLACFAKPCPTLELTSIDGSPSVLVAELDLSRTLKPYVDEAWLRARIEQGRTLLAGEAREAMSFDTAALFLRLPERVACAQYRPPACSKGEVPTVARDTDRCTYFDGCVAEGPCPLWLVERQCDEGYRKVSFATQPNACEQVFCDPEFAE